MLKETLIRGIKVTIPLMITIMIIVWVLSAVETFFGYLLKPLIPSHYYFTGLGAIVGIALIFLIGLVINAWIIRILYQKAERLIDKIPLVKTIYQSIQDFMDVFDNKKEEFGTPVVIEFQNMKILGFVTKKTCSDLPLNCPEHILVYIPMSYQIGGFTIFFPPSMVKPVDMNVQDMMKFILTAGIVSNRKHLSD